MGNPQLQDPTAAAPPACKERGLLQGAAAPAAPCRQARGHIASLKMEKKKAPLMAAALLPGSGSPSLLPRTASEPSAALTPRSHPSPSPGARAGDATLLLNPQTRGGPTNPQTPRSGEHPHHCPAGAQQAWEGAQRGLHFGCPLTGTSSGPKGAGGGPALQPFPPTPSSTKPHLPVGLPCCHGPPTSATLLAPPACGPFMAVNCC